MNRGLWLIVAVLVLGSVGFSGWMARQHSNVLDTLDTQDTLIRHLGQQSSEFRNQLENQSRMAQEQRQQIEALSLALAASQSQNSVVDQNLAALREDLQGGRKRLRLQQAELLIRAADQAIQFQHDRALALHALEQADQWLSQDNDPRWLPLRQALAEDRQSLAAIDQPDTTHIALALSGLINQAPTLPLLQAERQEAVSEFQFYDLFSLRRDDRPLAVLHSEVDLVHIKQILLGRLEVARLAVLQGDNPTYLNALQDASRWLRQHYVENKNTLAVQAELARLGRLVPAPALPHPDRSLDALSKVLP